MCKSWDHVTFHIGEFWLFMLMCMSRYIYFDMRMFVCGWLCEGDGEDLILWRQFLYHCVQKHQKIGRLWRFWRYSYSCKHRGNLSVHNSHPTPDKSDHCLSLSLTHWQGDVTETYLIYVSVAVECINARLILIWLNFFRQLQSTCVCCVFAPIFLSSIAISLLASVLWQAPEMHASLPTHTSPESHCSS